MAVIQRRPKQKESGRNYKKQRRKKIHEKGRNPTLTKLGETKRKTIRAVGGDRKNLLLQVDTVNLLDPKDKKFYQVKIKNVVENKANRNFVRRNIITKGTIIETEKGKARITSRPGQTGSFNAVLI